MNDQKLLLSRIKALKRNSGYGHTYLDAYDLGVSDERKRSAKVVDAANKLLDAESAMNEQKAPKGQTPIDGDFKINAAYYKLALAIAEYEGRCD